MFEHLGWLVILPVTLAGLALGRGLSGHRAWDGWISGVLALQSTLVVATLLAQLVTGAPPTLIQGGGIGFYLDPLSLAGLLLVGVVGSVVQGFSLRHLEGDPRSSWFHARVGFCIAALGLMVISGSLWQFVSFWLMASLSLHGLLQFHQESLAARRGAWMKMMVVRGGDFLLLLAMLGIYESLGTLQIPELLSLDSARFSGMTFQVSMVLLVVGCLVKSVQFPFHFWLPATLNAPTPVSALMHAGIVNAGGWLILRVSPLIVQSSTAMQLMFVVGLITMVLGTLVMMTQSAVKNQLVYSTVAQMGFMMLEFGLGGFGAGLVHLIAHSLYKAYAFLSSGSVLEQEAARPLVIPAKGIQWATALLTPIVFLGVFTAGFGFWNGNLPGFGEWILLAIAALAILHWALGEVESGTPRSSLFGLPVLLSLASLVALLGAEQLLAGMPHHDVMIPLWQVAVSAVALVSLFVLPWIQSYACQSEGWSRFWLYASKGFYVERWVQSRWSYLARN